MGNAELIRTALPCSVELPAGTGKTETIAELVKSFADEGKRSLVLALLSYPWVFSGRLNGRTPLPV